MLSYPSIVIQVNHNILSEGSSWKSHSKEEQVTSDQEGLSQKSAALWSSHQEESLSWSSHKDQDEVRRFNGILV